jgi:RNA polymerase sigma factor (sigma-70 family)
MSKEILDYIEPVYRFCLNRLRNRQDAEDLAQEILLCILESSKKNVILNLNAYVWRIAHNRYARKISNYNKESIVLFGDEYLFDICDEKRFEDEGFADEEEQNVFFALHTLSSMYRDILVDYYVNEFDVSKIAQKYGISRETVKWRLYTGREKMKERFTVMSKTYEKVKMHIMCNGSFNPNRYLYNQIYKAIAISCYENALTIEEISMATGIPTLYLEESLDHMESGDALEKVGNKYQTNFIIVHDNDNKRMQSELEPFIKEITNMIWKCIENKIDSIRSIGFYGADFRTEKLAYILVPEIIRGASNQVKYENPELSPPLRPIRKDGGNGWFIVTEGIERIDDNFSGCNNYVYTNDKGDETGRITYYWLGGLFEDNLNVMLQNFKKEQGNFNLITGEYLGKDAEEKAKLLKYNLIQKDGDKYYSAIPIFNDERYKVFRKVLEECFATVKSPLEKWMNKLVKEFKAFTPKRLNDQILGNVDSYSFNAGAFVTKELQKQGKMIIPITSDVFTANIFYIAK